MGTHIVNGKFQSDKYPTCPPGKVPLSVEDESAQDLLWLYAQRRRPVDQEFARDLEISLIHAGYKPPIAFGALRARAQVRSAIEEDLDGKGEALMKECWEDCHDDEDIAAANQELRRILGCLP